MAKGDISTAYFEDLDDEVADEQLERSGVGDVLRESGGGGSFNELARRHTAPMRKGAGGLLEERDPRKIFKSIDGVVGRQRRLSKNREEKGKHFDAVRGGQAFSYLEKSEDRSVYKQALPDFVDDGAWTPVPNKMAELCKTIINQLLVDDYLPNPKADGDTDRDRGAQDLTKKFLRHDATAHGTNDKQMLREALNTNITKASSFAMCWVDHTGGGWRPKQVMAHPQALDANKPMIGPKIDPKTKKPAIDPTTGMAVMEKAKTPVLRYVAEIEEVDPEDPEGEPTVRKEFTNDPARAARLWLPKLRRTQLLPTQVRTVPHNVTVFEAQEIVLLMWEPIGEAKKRFPILNDMSRDQLRTLASWRPKTGWKQLIPDALRPKGSDDESATEGPHDDTLIFWYHHFCRVGTKYVDGSEIAVSGANDGILLKRDTLREDVETDDGTLAPVLLEPGITQFIALQDTDGGDPFGMAPIEEFSGANEAYAQIWMGLLEAMDKAVHLNMMIPSTSSITRAEWNRRDGTPLDVLTAADKPFFEEPPVIPAFIDKMLAAIELHLNTAAGTNETASGLDSPFSISGKAKEIAIKQARVQLAQYWQNTVNGITHWWKIKTQLAQAYLTVPQKVAISGEDSAYKQPYWVGQDLVGITQVALQPGSGSMMGPAEKVQWVGMMQSAGYIDLETAADIARAAMSDDLGLPPNIHEERINRCIAKFAEGEPPEWRESYAAWEQYQQAYQQWFQQATERMRELLQTGAAVDEATAQQMAQTELPPPPEVPEPWTPFDERPNDGDPAVAMLHYRRMNRFASTAEYAKHEDPWRSHTFDQAFARIAAAAGVKSLAQQAEEAAAAAQQQANAQAQGNAEKETGKAAAEQAKAQDRQAEREHKSAEADKSRDHELEVQARDNMVKDAAATSAGSAG